MSASFPYLPPENSSFSAGRNGGERLQDESEVYYPQYSTRTTDFQGHFGSSASGNEPSSSSHTFHGVNVDQHLHHNAQNKRDMYYAPEDYTQSRFAAFPHATAHSGLTRIQTDHFDDVPRQGFAPGIVSATSSSSSQSPERALAEKSPSTAGVTDPGSISPTAYASRTRSEKARIQLASDQPLTTQGKVRTRVYVACIQCRGRKIRCDGAKPVCHNCSRRADNTGQCSYDAAPKRRGPDKTPGARQRSANPGDSNDKGRRRSRKRGVDARSNDSQSGVSSPDSAAAGVNPRKSAPYTALFSNRPLSPRQDNSITIIHEGGTYSDRSHAVHSPVSEEHLQHINAPYRLSHGQPHIGEEEHLQQDPAAGHTGMLNPHGYTIPLSQTEYPYLISDPSFTQSPMNYDDTIDIKPIIHSEPSLHFTRDTWWDALLRLYSTPDYDAPATPIQLSSTVREVTVKRITSDLYFLFRHSPYWFSFVNVPRFLQRLNPTLRRDLQPSLIPAALAIATFLQSSENEQGERGRHRALRLRDYAQGALDASLNGGWINEDLVQASWLLAFFEICAHPLHSSDRVRSSLKILDGLIRTLSLTTLDHGDSRVPVFHSHAVPTIQRKAVSPQDYSPDVDSHSGRSRRRKECSCQSFTLARNSPASNDLTPLWTSTPAWPDDWPESELKKEECRRLVWSSVILAAGHSSYASASSDISPLDLHIMNPAHYALLFPGEVLMSSGDVPEPKDSIWALYMRTMLLWHSCMHVRQSSGLDDEGKARFAMDAWLEVGALEEALSSHSCGIERAFMFQGREYLFNTRMYASDELQRLLPEASSHASQIVYRQKAEEWLNHQASVARRLAQPEGLSSITGQPTNTLFRRPFYLFWLMSQICRTLRIWYSDTSLIRALDVSKNLCAPIEELMALWPCPEQRRRYTHLRQRLTLACYDANIPPPPTSMVTSLQ